MADNEIVVATRYTTEGYDAALSKADRIGQRMLRLSRDIGGIGRFLNNDFLIGVSNALGGIEDMIGAVSELSKVIRSLPPIGAAGVIFGGAALAANAAGSAYNTATGTVDAGTFVAAAQRLQDALAKIPADQAAAAMETFSIKMAGATSAQQVAGMNALADSINSIGNAAQKNAPLLSDFYNQANQLLPRMMQYQQEQAAKRFSNLTDSIKGQLNTATAYQDKLSSASQKYHAAQLERAKELGQLNIEIANRRIEAAQSLAADLAKMDSTYYANRLQMAQSFGLETQRAEEDHQRNMRRLQESHDKRLRKLADSRDALGLEDEMESFEDERRAAEEDYQTAQARRNQDYANQLRDMERAFQQQRQERIAAYNQQLQDIAVYNTTQRQLIAQQMRDIAKAVMDAFTQAARTYTQSNTSNTSTTNNVNMTTNVNGAGDPLMTAQLVHTEVARLFRAATL